MFVYSRRGYKIMFVFGWESIVMVSGP